MKKIISLICLITCLLSHNLLAQTKMYEVISKSKEKTQQKKDGAILKDMVRKANAGDLDVQYKLGYMYRTGKRPDNRNIQVARKVGILGYQSNSFKRDYKKSFFWLSKSAKKAYSKAENELGLLYEFGKGVTQNTDYAFYWYLKAAWQNLAVAQNNIARLYFLGKGVGVDYRRSYVWASIASDNGSSMAKRGLSLLLSKLSEEERKEASQLKERLQQILSRKAKTKTKGGR